MSGTITAPPPEAHKCEGIPLPALYHEGTVWTCDDCGKKFVVVRGAQYNESYLAWRTLTEENKNGADK
jgi:ribosomal protein L37AE/L43A